MQRLPYNGAPRAHKLRHNVISSSLFNERWQRGARTFYHDVFAVLARSPSDLPLFFFLSFFVFLYSFSLSFSFPFLMLSSYLLPASYHRYHQPPPSSPPSRSFALKTCCEPYVTLSSRSLKRNPPTYVAARPHLTRPSTRFARIEISFSRRERALYRAANHHFSITCAISSVTAVFAFAITRVSFSSLSSFFSLSLFLSLAFFLVLSRIRARGYRCGITAISDPPDYRVDVRYHVIVFRYLVKSNIVCSRESQRASAFEIDGQPTLHLEMS